MLMPEAARAARKNQHKEADRRTERPRRPDEYIPPLGSKRICGTKLGVGADVNDPQLRRLLDMLAADAESPPLLKS